MAEKDGVTIPFNVEADGADVTIEKLAAAVMGLTAQVDALGKTTKGIKGAVQFTAFAEGLKLAQQAWGGIKGIFSDFTDEMDRASAFGSKFQNMSLQFNTSAESLQKLAAAGKPFGVGVEQMTRSINLLDRNMSKLGPQFKKFGIDVKALAGKDGAEKLQSVLADIGKLKPGEQSAASMALLKDRTGAFLKLVRDPEGMKGAIKDFEDFGLAVSNNAVGALDKFGNQKDLIGDIFSSIKTNVAGAVASSGAFQEAIRIVTEYLGKLSKWVKDNQATIQEWTSKGILLAVDALSFLATKVVPKAIDAFAGFKIILAGLQYAFESLGNVAIFLYDTLSNPTAIGKNLETLKAVTAETGKRFNERVSDAMKQNAELQAGAKVIGDTLKTVRGRIASAATEQGQFAAKLLDTADAASLGAEQIEKLGEATKAWEEKMKDVARTTATGFTELADKSLPEAEQKVNALFRTIVEQERKTREDFAKENEKLAKQGLPGLDPKSMEAALDGAFKLARAKADQIREEAGEAIADAAQKRIDSMRDAIIGNFDDVLDKAQDMQNALADIFGKDSKTDFGTSDLQTLAPAAIDALISKWGELAAAAEQAGKPAEEYVKKLHEAEAAKLVNAGDTAKVTAEVDKQLVSMRLVEATEKLHNSTLKEVLAAKVKSKEITQEEADKLLPKAVSGAETFRDVLEMAAQASQLLGDEIGSVVGGLISAAAAGEQAAAAIAKAKESGEGMGKALMGAAASALSVASSIASANKQQLSGAKGAASGAMQGASFGAAFGPWGAAIGAVGGALIGFFSGSKFRKIAKDAGKVLGDGLSKETVSAIQEDMKKLDLSASQASLLHIGDAMIDTEKSAHEFAGQMNDLLKGIADGTIPAKEGIAALEEGFAGLADEAEKAGTVGDRALVGLIKNARALGQLTPQMKAFVSEQLDAALEGVHKFVAAVKGLSDEAITKLGKDSGVVFGAMFDALVSERGIIAAVDALKDDFTTLKETLSKSLGQEAMEAILGPFGAAFDTLGNEKLRPIFEGIDGLTQAMKGLANAGFLSTDQFTAMQHATATLFDEAIAGGADMKTALTAVAPSIQAAISAAEQFGVPLDADTQRLKDLAEQNGITFKTDPQQAMLDVLVSIAEVMGAKIPESVAKMRDSVVGGTQAMTGAAQSSAAAQTEAYSASGAAVADSFSQIAMAGQETFDVLQGGAGDLASSLSGDIPDAAQEAMKALRDLQATAANPVEVGGGGAAGGTAGPKNISANVSVNLGINENPLAAADTAAAMRKATVEWTADAIQDRLPGIVASIEEAIA